MSASCPTNRATRITCATSSPARRARVARAHQARRAHAQPGARLRFQHRRVRREQRRPLRDRLLQPRARCRPQQRRRGKLHVGRRSLRQDAHRARQRAPPRRRQPHLGQIRPSEHSRPDTRRRSCGKNAAATWRARLLPRRDPAGAGPSKLPPPFFVFRFHLSSPSAHPISTRQPRQFTLSIEKEFQIVDPVSRELKSHSEENSARACR